MKNDLIFTSSRTFWIKEAKACVVIGPQILIALGIYLLAKHYDGGSSGSEIFPSSSSNGVDQRNKNQIQSVAYMWGAIGLIVYGLVVLIWSFVLWSAIRRTKNLVSHSMKILWSNIASGLTLVGLAILCFCQQFAWLAVVLITLAKLEVKGWALIIALPAFSSKMLTNSSSSELRHQKMTNWRSNHFNWLFRILSNFLPIFKRILCQN